MEPILEKLASHGCNVSEVFKEAPPGLKKLLISHLKFISKVHEEIGDVQRASSRIASKKLKLANDLLEILGGSVDPDQPLEALLQQEERLLLRGNLNIQKNTPQKVATPKVQTPTPVRFATPREQTPTPVKFATPRPLLRSTQKTPRVLDDEQGFRLKTVTPKMQQILMTRTPIRKELDFEESEDDKRDHYERADQQRKELLHEKAMRAKKAREEREELVRVRRIQLENERMARLNAKIQEKSPARTKVPIKQGVPTGASNSSGPSGERVPLTPRVPIKKALVDDDKIEVHVTQPSSLKRHSPKRKSRRNTEESSGKGNDEKPLEKLKLADLSCEELDQSGDEPFILEKVKMEPESPMVTDGPRKSHLRVSTPKSVEVPPRTSQKSNQRKTSVESQENQIEMQTPSALQSQASTPLAESTRSNRLEASFVSPRKIATASASEDNYGIDDLNSGDETDDEDKPRKTIPQWAKGTALIRSVRMQARLNYNTNDYFGPKQDVDLDRIFGAKRYKPRSSSAVWHSPINRPRPGFSTLDSSVVVEEMEED